MQNESKMATARGSGMIERKSALIRRPFSIRHPSSARRILQRHLMTHGRASNALANFAHYVKGVKFIVENASDGRS